MQTAKNAIALVGILIVSFSFGVSRNDHSDIRENKNTFVCNKNKDKETREYQKDLKEQKRLGDIQTRLLSDPNVVNDTCKKLKKKEQGKCQQDVAKLRDVTRDLVKINKEISEYELCYLAPKCGSAIATSSATEPVANLCASGSVVIGVIFDPTTVDASGNGMWTWRCGIVGSSTGETCYAPRTFTYSWMVGSWGTCVGSQQIRTVSCQNDLGQTVSNTRCTDTMPVLSQVCQMSSVTQIQSSHYNSSPLDAANMLAEFGIIMNYSDRPSYYRIDETMNRQEYLGILLKTMGLMTSSDYQCQNIFSDVSEQWVCRVAETALANGLISKQTNEQGQTLFRGTSTLSVYEILVLGLKSQCIGTEDHSVSGVRAKVQSLGIINADVLNMTAAGTRGDIYLSLATFMDYLSLNLYPTLNPSAFDMTIPTCTTRLNASGDDRDVLCTLFPDLCE